MKMKHKTKNSHEILHLPCCISDFLNIAQTAAYSECSEYQLVQAGL